MQEIMASHCAQYETFGGNGFAVGLGRAMEALQRKLLASLNDLLANDFYSPIGEPGGCTKCNNGFAFSGDFILSNVTSR